MVKEHSTYFQFVLGVIDGGTKLTSKQKYGSNMSVDMFKSRKLVSEEFEVHCKLGFHKVVF